MGRTAVVFVHGLFSSSKTWRPLCQLLKADADLAGITLLPFDYPTPKFNLNPLKIVPDFNHIARSLKTFLDHSAGDFDDIVLVTHSQGGLIVQRYLAQALSDGRGNELQRIRRVILFACPNTGSELFRAYRKVLFFRHPQVKALAPLNEGVQQARAIVINRAIHARSRSDSEQPVDVVVYAGLEDGVVTPTSAHDVFPQTATVPGDHFSIVKPDNQRHRTYVALKADLLKGIPTAARSEATNHANGVLVDPSDQWWTETVDESGRRRWLRFAVPATIVMLVCATLVAFRINLTNDTARPLNTATSSAASSSTLPTSQPGGPLDLACDNAGPAVAKAVSDIVLCVVYWCQGSFHTLGGQGWIAGRGQIKVRPLITNKSGRDLDVSIAPAAAVRLLVSTTRPPTDWWLPPQRTAEQGDHPISVSWNGQILWAIPPNMNGDAVPMDLPGGLHTWDGFATLKWDFGILGPGQTAFKPLRINADGSPIQEGDLVYDVPSDEQSRLIGLAVVDRNDPTRILAFSDRNVWPPSSDLNSF